MNAMGLYFTAYLVTIGTPGLTLQPDPHTNEMTAIEEALRVAEADLAGQVRRTLGFPSRHTADGDTATRITVWTQLELNDLYEQFGGTVTSRIVQRTYESETTTDTEIAVTVNLPGVATVQLVTDWYEPDGGHDLPVMRAITALTAA